MTTTAPGLQTPPTTTPAYLAWQDDSGVFQALMFDLIVTEDYDLDVDVTEHPVEIGKNVSDNAREKLDQTTLDIWCTNEPIDSNNWATMIPGNLPISIPAVPFTPDPTAGIVEYDEYENFITERALLGLGAGLIGGAVAGPVGGAVASVGAGLLAGAILPGISVPRVVSTDAGSSMQPDPPQPPTIAQTFGLSQNDDFVSKMISTLRTLKKKPTIFSVIAPRLELDSMVIVSMKVHRGVENGTGAKITLGLKEIRIVSTVNVPAPKPTIPKAKPPVNKGAQNTTDAPPKKSSDLFLKRHPSP